MNHQYLSLFLALFLLLLLPSLVSAQNSNIELLKSSVINAGENEIKVSLINSLAQEYLNINNGSQAMIYAEQAFNLADKLNDAKGKAQSLLNLGKSYRLEDNFSKSIENYLQSQTIFETLNDQPGLVAITQEIGLLYQEWGSNEKALTYFNQAYTLNMSLQESSPESKANLLGYMAGSYTRIKNYPKAIEYYNRVLEIHTAQNNKIVAASTLNKIASIYKNNGQYDEALTQTLKAMEIYRELNNDFALAQCLNNIGFLYRQKGEDDKALNYFNQSLTAYKKQISVDANPYQNTSVLTNIGVIYSTLEDYRTAEKYYNEALTVWEKQNNLAEEAKVYNYLSLNYFLNKNNDGAITNVRKAIDMAQKVNALNVLNESYQILAQIYQSENDYKEASKYEKLGQMYKEALSLAEKNKQQESFEKELVIQKKESDFKLLLSDKEKQVMAVNQLKLEKEKQEQELTLKANELALLKRNQELQNTKIENQRLEQQRVQQLLQLTQQKAQTDKQKQEIMLLQKNKELQDLVLKEQESKEKEQQKALELAEKDKELQKLQLEEEVYLRQFFIIGIILGGIIFLLIFIGYIQNRRKNKLLAMQKNDIEIKNVELSTAEEELRQNVEELQTQRDYTESINAELQTQSDTLQMVNKELDIKNSNITSSINAALNLQSAILPQASLFEIYFKDFFILFKPKDIVSGDFYWLELVEGKIVLAVADCTGHGIPGAFMSLIGNNLLDKIIKVRHFTEPALILGKLHKEIQTELKQKETTNRNGMDIGLCIIEELNDEEVKITFSGAKRPLYYIRAKQKQIEMLKGNRKSIGGEQNEEKQFTNQEIILPKGSTLFLCSDGFEDQNDYNRKRFTDKRMLAILSEFSDQPLKYQKEVLEKALQNHMTGTDQRDDIMLIGVKV